MGDGDGRERPFTRSNRASELSDRINVGESYSSPSECASVQGNRATIAWKHGQYASGLTLSSITITVSVRP